VAIDDDDALEAVVGKTLAYIDAVFDKVIVRDMDRARKVEGTGAREIGASGWSGERDVAINARHRDALERARAALMQAAQAADGDAFEECVALDLKTALLSLGEIIGETATEDLLDQIFSTFCIGK